MKQLIAFLICAAAPILAAESGAMTDEERAFLIEQLEQSKKNMLSSIQGLTEAQWRREWESSRLFLTADGEKDKTWGNETIRWHPGERWLEIKLPAPLAGLANRPHGRYRD